MSTTTSKPVLLPNNQTISEYVFLIQKFFNGDSIEKIREDLDNLRDTTITESYGELDKEDKWLMIELIHRISGLVDAAHLLISK